MSRSLQSCLRASAFAYRASSLPCSINFRTLARLSCSIFFLRLRAHGRGLCSAGCQARPLFFEAKSPAAAHLPSQASGHFGSRLYSGVFPPSKVRLRGPLKRPCWSRFKRMPFALDLSPRPRRFFFRLRPCKRPLAPPPPRPQGRGPLRHFPQLPGQQRAGLKGAVLNAPPDADFEARLEGAVFCAARIGD